jgi:hypothetical protein
MFAPAPAPPLSTVLERIGETQARLPPAVSALLGVAVLAATALPAWLLVEYIDTMAHEGTHALVTSGTGGTVRSVRVWPGGSGLTKSGGGSSVLSWLAGYLGPSAFGLAAAKLISIGHIVAVLWLAILLLGILLTMIHNVFGFCSVAVTGFVLYLFARYGSIGTETVVAYLLAWFLLASGLRSVLRFPARPVPGQDDDAVFLVKATWLPRVLWIGIWLAGTTFALVLGGRLLV